MAGYSPSETKTLGTKKKSRFTTEKSKEAWRIGKRKPATRTKTKSVTQSGGSYYKTKTKTVGKHTKTKSRKISKKRATRIAKRYNKRAAKRS